MMMLIGVLKRMFPEAKVHGHREFAAKACPCFDAGEEYKSVDGQKKPTGFKQQNLKSVGFLYVF